LKKGVRSPDAPFSIPEIPGIRDPFYFSMKKLTIVFMVTFGVPGDPVGRKRWYAAFDKAVSNGHSETVRLLLDSGVDWDARRREEDKRSLFLAAHWGRTEVLRVFLERCPDVNVRVYLDHTSLHIAVKYSEPECVDLLLKKGAAIDITTDEGFTALHLVAQSMVRQGDVEIIDLLMDRLREEGTDVRKLLFNETLLRHTDTFNAWKKEVQEPENAWYKNALKDYGIDLDALLSAAEGS